MNLLETIKGRRSIRRYQSKEIPEDALQKILEAVQWSPSWANTQCWELVLVKDPAIKESLQGIMAKGNPAKKSIVEAPVVIAMCAKLKSSGYYKGEVVTKFGDWFMYDIGIATQNLCLMACSLGLGTVIAGLFDHDKAAQILKLPDGYEVVTLIPVGYAAADSKAPKRREITEFTHDNTF